MDALGYDLAKIIEAAVTTADSVEPAKIREALANLENVQGATAVISYKGGNGTPTRPVNVHPHRRTASGCWSSAKAPDPAIVPDRRAST